MSEKPHRYYVSEIMYQQSCYYYTNKAVTIIPTKLLPNVVINTNTTFCVFWCFLLTNIFYMRYTEKNEKFVAQFIVPERSNKWRIMNI